MRRSAQRVQYMERIIRSTALLCVRNGRDKPFLAICFCGSIDEAHFVSHTQKSPWRTQKFPREAQKFLNPSALIRGGGVLYVEIVGTKRLTPASYKTRPLMRTCRSQRRERPCVDERLAHHGTGRRPGVDRFPMQRRCIRSRRRSEVATAAFFAITGEQHGTWL